MNPNPPNDDPRNPYRDDPFDVHRDRFGPIPEHEVAQFDSSDGCWGWVRLGILSLMFGYFCVPIFLVAVGVVTRMGDADLMQAVLYVGTSATLIPVLLGWSLCSLTPNEVGTRKFAIIVAIAVLAQIWIGMGKLWPDVVEVPQLLIRFRSLISLVAISCMLRYLQGTFEYLRPGHNDTWVRMLQKLTRWLSYVLIAGVFYVLAVGMPPQGAMIPIMGLVFLAFLAMMILFWGCLFRLWFLLRGEGQFEDASY